MKPFDSRLLRYSRSTRVFLAALVVVSFLNCGLIIVQAFALTDIVVRVFTGGADVAAVSGSLAVLAGAIAGRALTTYLADVLAFHSAAKAKSELRLGVVAQAVRLGPIWLARRNSGHLTQLLTRGVDGMDAYFARYLPQLVLAVIVPLTITVVILAADPTAAIIVAITVPLIPIFMILVGMYTRRRVSRQWYVLGVLSGHFMDVLAGLPTLKAFGRARVQSQNIRTTGEMYRRSTMGVLRVSFLSSLVLEVLAMLSVAMVAVSIGVRLVDGTMTLAAGLLVLVLVPDVYLPLRQIGVHYHAAAEGLGAAAEMVAILEEEPPLTGSRATVPNLSESRIILRDVTVDYSDRGSPALANVDIQIEPGLVTAVIGPSGSGKSTMLAVLEGFVAPSGGAVSIEVAANAAAEVKLAELDPAAWRAHVGWVGQEPHLIPATLADNVRLAATEATDRRVVDALNAVGLTELVNDLPDGINTPVGEGGRPLSSGQARRVGFARVVCADPQLVLLDEPTAALDGEIEDAMIDEIERLAVGRTVVVVAHRPSLIARADRVITLDQGRVVSSSLVLPTDLATDDPSRAAVPAVGVSP